MIVYLSKGYAMLAVVLNQLVFFLLMLLYRLSCDHLGQKKYVTFKKPFNVYYNCVILYDLNIIQIHGRLFRSYELTDSNNILDSSFVRILRSSLVWE